MGLFSFAKNIFRKEPASEYILVQSFLSTISTLLSQDKYLAGSDYQHLSDDYSSVYELYNSSRKSNSLSYLIKKQRANKETVDEFLKLYEQIKDLSKQPDKIRKHNDDYISAHLASDKSYLDKILNKVDPDIKLDDDQRKVILSEEDNTLVIAGAGAGKTTTLAAKAKYLVEKKHIDPKDILIVSFTNKAVNELKERINGRLKLPCLITTFHKIGYTLLSAKSEVKRNIAEESCLYTCIRDYLTDNVMSKPEMVDKIVLFFSYYIHAPYTGKELNEYFKYLQKADYPTLRSQLGDYLKEYVAKANTKRVTINSEFVRSAEECRIANFLYLNGIDYEYEAPYQYHILKSYKPYTPDFTIRQGDKIAYIEHFGVSEDGHNSMYSAEQEKRYQRAINDKIILHRQHGTKLMYTFSSYKDGSDMLTHLKYQLLEAGFKFHKRDENEVYKRIATKQEEGYLSPLIRLLCTFISNFKVYNYNEDDFDRMIKANYNVRTTLFLEIAKECYLTYKRKLSESNSYDFADLINESSSLLEKMANEHKKLSFKYIIVDEYQDISKQRFDLVKALKKVCDAKVIAVGDDWQSIYAFSGSDITLFTHFCSIIGYGEQLQIRNTYRNAQEVIDIAGSFIQKNPSQIKKSLFSPKHIRKPVVVLTYDDAKRVLKEEGGIYATLGETVEKAIKMIEEVRSKKAKGKICSTLLIGRYSFDARNLCFSNRFSMDKMNNRITCNALPNSKLMFLTAHSSKGLGYDDVIIINAKDDMYGFPSQIEDDPVLKLVETSDPSMDYAEERRLFYVSLTRTKNRVFIIAPKNHPSQFVLELLRDYPSITLHGEIDKDEKQKDDRLHCPRCGYPLMKRSSSRYGLNLYCCTNEPELCDYITNIPESKLCIEKCDCCRDGYLIAKKSKKNDSYILGCTNYKEDGSGCNKILMRNSYIGKEEYTEDKSISLKDYGTGLVEAKPRVAKQLKQELGEEKPRKAAEVHHTERKDEAIDKENFHLITLQNGTVITDVSLLKHLRRLRAIFAKKDGVAAYLICQNDGLVSMATYKPTNHDEFVALKGLGEKTFESHGQDFMDAISQFYKSRSKNGEK